MIDKMSNQQIDAAYALLRDMNDGHEPYALAVAPMARALARHDAKFEAKHAEDRRLANALIGLEQAYCIEGDYTEPDRNPVEVAMDRLTQAAASLARELNDERAKVDALTEELSEANSRKRQLEEKLTNWHKQVLDRIGGGK